MEQRSRTLFALVGIVSLLALSVLGCIVSVTPEEATNVIGERHTVTVDVFGTIPTAIPSVIPSSVPFSAATAIANQPGGSSVAWTVSFRVISGPNTGKQSNNDCVPSCNGFGSQTVTWSYFGVGGPGLDTIEVCVTSIFGTDCRIVTKTWIKATPTATVQPRLGNVLGGVAAAAAQGASRSQVAPAADPPQVTAPRTGAGPQIQAPNTGDGGLAASD